MLNIMNNKLNFIELFAYLSVWVCASLYSLVELFVAQTDILDSNRQERDSLEDLKPGWSFISRLQDVSDIEWSSWKFLIRSSWFYLLITFSISEAIRKNNIYFLKYWYIISTVIFVSLHSSVLQLFILSIQPIIFAAVIFCGGGKKCIWVISISLLLSYNSLKYKQFFWVFLDREDLKDEEVYLMLFAMPWTELRCISYCIDYVDKREKFANSEKVFKENSIFTNIINMFSYIFYLPLLYTGPVVMYEDFEKSFTVVSQPLIARLKRFALDMSLYFIYTFLLDLSLHYIYFYAMRSNMKLLKMLPAFPLCGGGFWMGIEFHMKYVISYGTTTAFSRLDQIEAPPTPRCIARIHVYSQMWRYFDVGLYKFLAKYVYRPTCQSVSRIFKLRDTLSKLLASLVTFIFTYIWHGHKKSILIWAILNYVGLALEQLGEAISKTENYKWFKMSVLRTEKMETRFIAMVCAPLLALSGIANFYLFAGRKVGNLFLERFVLHPSLWNSFILLVPLYCCCHVSIALKDCPSRTDVKQIKIPLIGESHHN